MASRGLKVATPSGAQLSTPTSRPRQGGRQGRHIDCICYKGVVIPKVDNHVDSFKSIGTDHELLEVSVRLRGEGRRRSHCTRPRVWTGGVAIIEKIDQGVLRQLARDCTKPKQGKSYRDPPEVKAAAREARRSNECGEMERCVEP